MARLFTHGFETGDDAVLYFDSSYGFTVQSDQARTGVRSIRTTLNGTRWAAKIIAGISECCVGFGIRSQSQGGDFQCFRFADGADNTLLLLQWLGTQCFRITCNGVDYDFPTFPEWDAHYYVEIRFVCDPSAGIIQAKLDGNLEVDQTGIDTGGPTNIERIEYRGTDTPADNHLWFDDIAANDTSGAIDNGWVGDIHLEPGFPNASGDLSEWTLFPDSGEADYEDIDEIPPDDDTTYLSGGSVPFRFLVHIADWDATGKAIQKVHINAIAKKLGAVGADQLKLIVKSGGSIALGSNQPLLTSYALYTYTLDQDPNGPQAWSDAGIDALQIGAEVSVV